MMKGKKIIVLILLVLITLTGCSYKELNELAIVTSIGIDYIDDEYFISTQIMNFEKNSDDGTSEEAILYEASGKSIVEALRNIMKQYPRSIYLGHLEVAILGRDVVEEKTNEIFDYFISSPECVNDFTVLVYKDGYAKDIINPQNDNEKKDKNPTKSILSSLENIESRQGSSYLINFEEFLSDYLKTGKDPVLPVIKMVDNDGYSKTLITDMVPFKDNVLGDALDKEQAIALSTLNNTYYDIPLHGIYKDTVIAILVFNPKSKMEVKVKSNKVDVNIKINLEGHASEVSKNVNLSKPEINNEISAIFKEKMKDYVFSLLNYCKENDVDILGIKNSIYKHYPKQYNNFKNVNIYEIADFNVDIDIKLYRYGNTHYGVSNN